MREMKCNLFTHVMLVSLMVGRYLGTESLTWSVGCCWAYGVLASFCAARLLDPLCYVRISQKNGWSMSLFYVGHALLHVLPCCLVVVRPPASSRAWHGVLAGTLHLTWTFTTEDGGIYLDRTYVSFPTSTWNAIWAVVLVVEATFPVLLSRLLVL